MVFLMRNCVCMAWILPFGWDWGGGRIAMRAWNVPGGLVANYSDALEGVWVFNRRTAGLP